jgi:hypothetical protein
MTVTLEAVYGPEGFHDRAFQYLGTIQGCPLLWDAQEHCPVWPDGEPQAVHYEADGSITIEAQCDVYRLPGYVRQPKLLDCGHGVRAHEAYVTWIAEARDTCLACAQEYP